MVVKQKKPRVVEGDSSDDEQIHVTKKQKSETNSEFNNTLQELSDIDNSDIDEFDDDCFSSEEEYIMEDEESLQNDEKAPKKVANVMNRLLTSYNEGIGSLRHKVKTKEEKVDSDAKIKSETLNEKEKRKAINTLKRSKITEQDVVKERDLRVLATQGVVQLFSAIESHRKEMRKNIENAKSEVAKEKVLKKASKDFEELLDKERNKTEESSNEIIKDENLKKPLKKSWDVFSSSFYSNETEAGWDKKDSDSD